MTNYHKVSGWKHHQLIMLQLLWVRNLGAQCGSTGFSGLTDQDRGVSRAVLLTEGSGQESPRRILQHGGRIRFVSCFPRSPLHLPAMACQVLILESLWLPLLLPTGETSLILTAHMIRLGLSSQSPYFKVHCAKYHNMILRTEPGDEYHGGQNSAHHSHGSCEILSRRVVW